jgi:hypothetical protein
MEHGAPARLVAGEEIGELFVKAWCEAHGAGSSRDASDHQ